MAAAGSGIVKYLTLEGYYNYAYVILLISYNSLGVGLLLAFMVLVWYVKRLAIWKIPGKEVIVSTFLPLGE
jgi:hypothetical protein